MNGLMMSASMLGMTTDPAAIAAAEAAKARIQSAYMMALHRPRSYDDSRVRILAACRRPDFAEKVEFRRKIGKELIVGPSIRFAELALREWGNVFYENQVIYDDENVRRIRITVIDLQTNATFGKEVQISKVVERRYANDREIISTRLNSEGKEVHLVKATEDEVLIREAAIVSKALRNEGLRLIPQEIVMEAVNTARKTMMEQDKKDPDAARKKLVDAFAAMGIMPTALEAFLGHPLAQCTPAETQELRGIYAAIKDGEAKWSDFANREEDADKDVEDKAAQLAETIKNRKKAAAAPVNEEAPTPAAAGVPDKTAEPVKASEPEPRSTNGAVTEVEKLRVQLDNALGEAGLGLNEAERGQFLLQVAGEADVMKLKKDALRSAVVAAEGELQKRMESEMGSLRDGGFGDVDGVDEAAEMFR